MMGKLNGHLLNLITWYIFNKTVIHENTYFPKIMNQFQKAMTNLKEIFYKKLIYLN